MEDRTESRRDPVSLYPYLCDDLAVDPASEPGLMPVLSCLHCGLVGFLLMKSIDTTAARSPAQIELLNRTRFLV